MPESDQFRRRFEQPGSSCFRDQRVQIFGRARDKATRVGGRQRSTPGRSHLKQVDGLFAETEQPVTELTGKGGRQLGVFGVSHLGPHRSLREFHGQKGIAVNLSEPARTNTRTHTTQVDAQLNFTSRNHKALPAGTGDTWTGTLTVPTAGDYWLNIQAPPLAALAI